jgi:hypothetical protein
MRPRYVSLTASSPVHFPRPSDHLTAVTLPLSMLPATCRTLTAKGWSGNTRIDIGSKRIGVDVNVILGYPVGDGLPLVRVTCPSVAVDCRLLCVACL